MSIFSKSTLKARHDSAAKALKQELPTSEMLLVCAGLPIQKPGGLDQTYSFLPNPEYFWLSGSRRAGGVMAFMADVGWQHFAVPVSDQERIWEGVDEQIDGNGIDQLSSFIAKQKPSKIWWQGAVDTARTTNAKPSPDNIQEAVNRARRCKDSEEVALVRRCADFALAGYKAFAENLVAGRTERDLQIIYEAAVLNAGAEKMPYDSIIGAGTRAAILHALPSTQILQQGQLVLIDAGADLHDYCVDITRVFAVGGKPSSEQKDLYSIVARAQAASLAKCRPGIAWTEVHQASALEIARGLKDLGVITGAPESALENGLVGLFFPHGVGHLVGQRVRDVGGIVGKPPAETCGIRLRINIELQENFLVTVEPGLYFIANLLNSDKARQQFKSEIAWDKIEPWLARGGVRLEDDILITKAGPENLTKLVPHQFH